ncbi:MAG: hypothetical protein UW68_C0018G0007 [Candidatus Collierbacteria bacterium GW2011_GWB1_44_6]|uniref:Uncharacterized protein n=1 Tax=Candidatus Collierbacteria bacterium GW2011_GWB1_44_6 TaxID=1618384 RepID=A0A0G1JNV8_9BACT|nr:MAG: hypothetical protein UW68_C0018G0007 [Candidatus Collierbacteria bacterium GW2011_GWB1_44_6]
MHWVFRISFALLFAFFGALLGPLLGWSWLLTAGIVFCLSLIIMVWLGDNYHLPKF